MNTPFDEITGILVFDLKEAKPKITFADALNTIKKELQGGYGDVWKESIASSILEEIPEANQDAVYKGAEKFINLLVS